MQFHQRKNLFNLYLKLANAKVHFIEDIDNINFKDIYKLQKKIKNLKILIV